MDGAEPIKRRRSYFTFGLRTLFVAVTVICCWLAWETSIVRHRRAVLREVQGNFSYQFVTAEQWQSRANSGKLATVSPLRRWLGDVAMQEVFIAPPYDAATQEQHDRVVRAFPEAEVRELHFEPCHPGCFPSGTLVDTPQARRRIESIRPGEMVRAFFADGSSHAVPVQHIFTTENRLWRVTTTRGVLLTTETQPLCVAFDRWTTAGDLNEGDEVLVYHDGAAFAVRVVEVARTERIATVFNLVLQTSEQELLPSFVAGGMLVRSKPPASRD